MSLIRKYKTKDNILIFDSDMDPSLSAYDSHLLGDLEDMESKHFWFKTRRDKITQLFQQKIEKNMRILEIGGGTGFVSQELKNQGFSIEMGDIHYNGLKYAQEKGIEKLYQFDLFNPPFRKEFDVICLFDVLEHQKEDKKALECLKRMLKPQGKIILTVPAHQWLWNRDDQINGHYRRYTKKSLAQICKDCHLKIKHVEYFFTFIVPFLYLRTFLNPATNIQIKTDEKLKMNLPLGMNSVCTFLTKLEFRLAKLLPNGMGGSLLMMAEAQD
jgi:2-polyprenyl-3-methyl-5-hydroxy-6-metoxy-1,4-benzoquinol methylase